MTKPCLQLQRPRLRALRRTTSNIGVRKVRRERVRLLEGGHDAGAGAAQRGEDPRAWGVDDVVRFVAGVSGCAGAAEAFRTYAVDGETLLNLDMRDAENELGIKDAVARQRLLWHVAVLMVVLTLLTAAIRVVGAIARMGAPMTIGAAA